MERGLHSHVRARVEHHPEPELARRPDDRDGFGGVHIAALVFGMQLDPAEPELPQPFELLPPGRGEGMDAAERTQPRQLVRRGREVVDGVRGLGGGGNGEKQGYVDSALFCRRGQPGQGPVVMGTAFSVDGGKTAGRELVREGMGVKIDDHGFIRFFPIG